MKSMFKKTGAVSALTLAAFAATPAGAQSNGPSTAFSPYVMPSLPSVHTTSLLTVGDSIGGYRMVGIPDGLGAFDNLNGTFTVLMNHELGAAVGTTRAHNARGSFVSKWVINKTTLQVLSGSDLMRVVFPWDKNTQASTTTPAIGVTFPETLPFAFTRFCSGDLPAVSAFFNAATGLGSQERIYMHGEEGGTDGLQLGTVVTGASAGNAYVLGKFNLKSNGSGGTAVGAWENAVASPFAQDKTVVVATSDGGTGIMNNSVSVYVGTKQSTGSEVEKAGLMNGTLKFVNVDGNTLEIADTTTRATNITSGTRFTLNSASATGFSRPEDGAWNPLNPREFYFVTTDVLDLLADGEGGTIGQTRLWRLTFDDITNPDLGGKIDLLINGRTVGTEKVNMFDNMTVNATTGVVYLQEDVGGADHNGKVWAYNPANDSLVRLFHHDQNRFGDLTLPVTAPFTRDEEASGMIDMSSILGPNVYLMTDQAHYPINVANPNGFTTPEELVEGGQLIVARIAPPAVPVMSTPWLALCATLVAGVGLVAVRRARKAS
jgi:hypothetical protein